MKRPEITREFIATTAVKFCNDNFWSTKQAADITRVYRIGGRLDGYETAKDLESMCGWSPTAMDVSTLEDFFRVVSNTYREVCFEWARDNNIQPPLPIGTMTTKGEITGIYARDAACYEIRMIGDAEPSRRKIVRFENAREIAQVAK